jgi:hypothetical protein
MQINLLALSNLDQTHPSQGERESRLLSYRCGSEANDIGLYEQKVVWRYDLPIGAYTPFDISDELVFRNRYILNNDKMTTRIENLWADAFKGGLQVPIEFPSEIDSSPKFWERRVGYDFSDPCIYDYRHITTIQNLDRVIRPNGEKMLNVDSVSAANKDDVYAAVRAGLDPNISNATAAQITANLIDYVDTDDKVTVVYDANISHFGFEQPCIYISEIAQNFYQPDPCGEPNLVEFSYAIELCKPYRQDDDPNGWHLYIANTDGSSSDTVINWTGSNKFHVLLNDNFGRIDVNFKDANDNNDVNAFHQAAVLDFNGNSLIELRRPVYDPCYGGIYVTADSILVPVSGVNDTNWLMPQKDPNFKFATHSLQRDISDNKPIRRLWDFFFGLIDVPTIGYDNAFVDTANPDVIQAHPANKPFTNVGEFGQLFYNTTYDYGGAGPLPGILEPALRINLADPNYQQVFKYLTVMDPTQHILPPDANETRIKGRININTAPWFVIAQLPWVSYHTQPNYDLARSIVDYRNKNGPFKSTGELMLVGLGSNDVNSIGYYESRVLPDGLLTPTDGIGDAFEERDAIFTRISNLVTVRSDVFTAYILVRVGENGPQKRVVAILDRSEAPAKPVKVIAIQPVPEPR